MIVCGIFSESESVQAHMTVRHVLSLKIQLPGGGWDPRNQFNTIAYFWLSHPSIWISNVICRGRFYSVVSGDRWLLLVQVMTIDVYKKLEDTKGDNQMP